MKRSAPLRRTSRLSRHAALRTRGRGTRFRGYVRNDAYLDWITARYCVACGCWPTDPHHIKTRNTGGHDRENVIPLCRRCHDEWHDHGRHTFAAKYAIEPGRVARALWEQYETLSGGTA